MTSADQAEADAAWKEAQHAAPERAPQEDPTWRAQQYQLYCEAEERRRRSAPAKIAEGVEPSIYGW